MGERRALAKPGAREFPMARLPQTPDHEAKASKPRNRPARLGTLVPALLEPTLRARGFASAQILAEWTEIVGSSIARCTAPLEIRWPRRRDSETAARPAGRLQERAEGATLVIACPGAFALEVQMAEKRILEQANRRFGFRAVTRLEIRQQPLPAPIVAAAPRLVPAEAIAEAERAMPDITDPTLRRALGELRAGLALRPAKPR
jgi:hypothetical protein